MVQASNILVGRDGRVRLSDLGVAAKLERHFSGVHHAFGSLERRNTFVGSPAYIAPELLTGIDKGWVTEGITHLFTHKSFSTFLRLSSYSTFIGLQCIAASFKDIESACLLLVLQVWVASGLVFVWRDPCGGSSGSHTLRRPVFRADCHQQGVL